MKTIEWISCCAAVGLILFAASGVRAEESPSPEESKRAATPVEDTTDANSRCKCAGEAGSGAVAKIQEALRGALRQTGLEFTDTPLEEVANVLQEDYGIPIQVDVPALEEIGIGPDEPVTISLHNISLRSALRLMLQRRGLVYIIRDEVLMITTPEAAEADLRVCVYNVKDLLEGDQQQQMQALMQVIVSCVARDTWSQNGGGEAEIHTLPPNLLVISQTEAVHNEIRELLAVIREFRHGRPAQQASSARGFGEMMGRTAEAAAPKAESAPRKPANGQRQTSEDDVFEF